MNTSAIRAQEFRSMLAAIAYVLQDHADHYFTMSEHLAREYIAETIQNLPVSSVAPGIASTLVEFTADTNRVAGVILESEAYLGCILAHYTDSGDIVRFVAIPA